MLRLGKAIYLSFLLKSILSVRLSNSLWRSNVLLYLEFKNVVSIFYCTFIAFIILLYTFLVISFDWYKEYMIYMIWFSKFSDVLPAFTFVKAICNLWSICLEVNILRLE